MRLRTRPFADPEQDLGGEPRGALRLPAWLVERWLGRSARPHPGACSASASGGHRSRCARAARATTSTACSRRRAPRCAPARRTRRCSSRAPGVRGAVRRGARRGLGAGHDGAACRAAAAGPRRGQRLLDLCAAPGGKTLHLADLLAGAGEVVACDVEPEKIEMLQRSRTQVRGDVRLDVAGHRARGAAAVRAGVVRRGPRRRALHEHRRAAPPRRGRAGA